MGVRMESWEPTLTVLDDAGLDTVAVGDGVGLAAAALVALADAVVEGLKVALVRAGDLFQRVLVCPPGIVEIRPRS